MMVRMTAFEFMDEIKTESMMTKPRRILRARDMTTWTSSSTLSVCSWVSDVGEGGADTSLLSLLLYLASLRSGCSLTSPSSSSQSLGARVFSESIRGRSGRVEERARPTLPGLVRSPRARSCSSTVAGNETPTRPEVMRDDWEPERERGAYSAMGPAAASTLTMRESSVNFSLKADWWVSVRPRSTPLPEVEEPSFS